MQATQRARVLQAALLLAAIAILAPQHAAAQNPVYSVIYSFKGGDDGASPHAGLIQSKNGPLYGTTYTGGTGSLGTVFELAPGTGESWTKTVLHNFSGSDGSLPVANLVFNVSGMLYGTTLQGGAAGGGGTVFELTPPSVAGGTWTQTVLYSFADGCNNQMEPYGAMVISSSGELFGTTYTSSGSNCQYFFATGGTVFMLAPPKVPGGSWTEDTLFNFWPPGGMGVSPIAGIVYSGGSLFGTTYTDNPGAGPGCGSVYEVSPPATGGGVWTGTAIHEFGQTPGDGCGSEAALTVGPGGVLYGTTNDGGSGLPCTYPPGLISGCGTVFQLTPPTTPGGSWTENVLYSFTATKGDGAYPTASVVIGENGVLYGTTQYGGSATAGSPCSYYGASGCGTVFQLTPPTVPGGAWTETILHSFTGQDGDGSVLIAGLKLSPSGTLYGTTSAGGNANKGTVFSVTP